MSKRAAPKGGEKLNANDESFIFIKILEKCKNGATKKDLITTILPFSLSNAQFRRSTAELVDKRLLHYDEKQMFLSQQIKEFSF